MPDNTKCTEDTDMGKDKDKLKVLDQQKQVIGNLENKIESIEGKIDQLNNKVVNGENIENVVKILGSLNEKVDKIIYYHNHEDSEEKETIFKVDHLREIDQLNRENAREREQSEKSLGNVKDLLREMLDKQDLNISCNGDDWAWIGDGIRKLSDELDDKKRSLETKEDELSDIKDKLAQKESELANKEAAHARELHEREEKQDRLDSIIGEVDRIVNWLPEKIDDFLLKTDEDMQNFVSKESECAVLWDRILAIFGGSKKLRREYEELKTRYHNLSEKVQSKDRDIADLKKDNADEIIRINNAYKAEICKRDSEISKRDNKISELDNKIESYTAKIGRLEKDVLEKDRKIESLEHKINAHEDTIKSLEDDVSDKISDNERLEEAKKALAEMLGEFESAADPYLEVYGLMVKCRSMTYAFENIGIPMTEDISRADIIKFINAFGRNFNMARIIYNSMDKDKSASEQPLTVEERALIDGINSFYRTRYGERFAEINALDCLGMDGNNEVKFERRNMRCLNNPRNTDIIKAKQIFVPLLRSENGVDVAQQAIIRGE